MLSGDEDKVMKASGTCYRGPRFYSYLVRVKNRRPGTRVPCPCWFQIALLVFLLTGHASCQQISRPPFFQSPTSTTLRTTTSKATSPALTPTTLRTTTPTATSPALKTTTLRTTTPTATSPALKTTTLRTTTPTATSPDSTTTTLRTTTSTATSPALTTTTLRTTTPTATSPDLTTTTNLRTTTPTTLRTTTPTATSPALKTTTLRTTTPTTPSPALRLVPTSTTTILRNTTSTATSPAMSPAPSHTSTTNVPQSATSTNTTSGAPQTTAFHNITKAVYYWLDVSVYVTGEVKNESDITNWFHNLFRNHLESCVSPKQTEANATHNMTTSLLSYNTTTTTTTTTLTQNYSQPTGEMGDGGVTGSNLFQGIEVSCSRKTALIRETTTCTILLKLKQPIRPCCILHSVCRGGKRSKHIHVVGKRVERVGKLPQRDGHMECSSFSQGSAHRSCQGPGTFVAPEKNSTRCARPRVRKKASCNCSTYCNGTAAYYYLQISIQDRTLNSSYVSSLIPRLKTPPPCSTKSNGPCPMSIIASKYKDAYVNCGSPTTNRDSCDVILSFVQEVPVCAVSTAFLTVVQSVEHIYYDGKVTRTAICGDSGVGGNLLKSNFTLVYIDLKPEEFCSAEKYVDDILSFSATCPKGQNVAVLLEQRCDQSIIPASTTAPNATTPTLIPTSEQQNTTTPSVNVTSSTLKTTAAAPNATTAANVTVTVTGTPNITTATANATMSVTTTTSMNTTSMRSTVSSSSTISMKTTSKSSTLSFIPTITTNIPTNTTKIPIITTKTTISINTIPTGTTITAGPTVVPATNITDPMTTAEKERAANRLLQDTRNVANLNSSQVNKLVSDLEDLLAGPTVGLTLGNTSIHIVSNLLGASADAVSESASRIIGIVDTVGFKLEVDGEAENILSQGLALSVKITDGTNFEGTSFSISDPTTVEVRRDRTRRSVETKSSIPQGSIRLPTSLTQNLTPQEQQQASRVQFNFYQNSTVFQDRSLLGQRRLISGVLGATVANLSISGLQEDVVIRLRNTEPVPANFVATCVFWDFTRNNKSGGWNPNGCVVLNSTDEETVCGCNHLTSFGILLDLSRQPVTSRLQATILTYITYIGCGISAIFLAVTLLTYLSFGKLRKDIPSKILIQLCLALLFLNLVFLVDAWLALYPEAVGLCTSTAWFLHYFLLASFSWMGLEAVHMYLALVKVFNSYVSHYMLKFSLVGWGIPLLVVIIVIAVDKDNYGLVTYGKFTDGSTDDFCWLKNDIAFYVAVVAYFCVIFVFNFIMFIVVMVQLCRMKRQNPHNTQHRTTLQDMRSVAGITMLLGLTWGFAFFAWGPVNLAFMYLFAIFNSFQGFFIFLFHCAVKENVRKQWRTYLCCGKLRLAENSEWSRTATQKTVKKSSVTRVTSLSFKSSQSNNSSSSSTFLGSDSSEQLSGVGSPIEDRTITADEEPSSDVILNELNRQYRNQSTT